MSLHRADLRNRLKLITLHLLLKDVLRSPKFFIKPFDIVILKMSFQTDGREALNVVRSIERVLDGRRLVYFDGEMIFVSRGRNSSSCQPLRQ